MRWMARWNWVVDGESEEMLVEEERSQTAAVRGRKPLALDVKGRVASLRPSYQGEVLQVMEIGLVTLSTKLVGEVALLEGLFLYLMAKHAVNARNRFHTARSLD